MYTTCCMLYTQGFVLFFVFFCFLTHKKNVCTFMCNRVLYNKPALIRWRSDKHYSSHGGSCADRLVVFTMEPADADIVLEKI